jgi:hypothetical protein
LSLRVPGLVILLAAIQLLLPPSLTLGPFWLIPEEDGQFSKCHS